MRDVRRIQSVVGLLFLLVVVTVIATLIIHRLQNDQTPTMQQQVNAVASQLRAPGDPSTVAVSSLGNAQTMRFEIEQDLQRGMSTQQVLNQMVKEYGEGVLATPGFNGFGKVVWVMPWLALAILALGVVWFLRNVVKVNSRTGGENENPRQDSEPLKVSVDAVDSSMAERLRDYL